MDFSKFHKIISRLHVLPLHAVRLLPKSQRAQPVPLSSPADDEFGEAPEDAEEGEAGDEDDRTPLQPEAASKAASQTPEGHKKDVLAGEVGPL